MSSPAAASMSELPMPAIATACRARRSRKASRPSRKNARRGSDARRQAGALFVEESGSVRNRGARGAITVGLVRAVGIAEGDAAEHPPVVGKAEMRPHDVGMERERRLRDGGDPQRLRRQHEARDITAAVDRTIDSE